MYKKEVTNTDINYYIDLEIFEKNEINSDKENNKRILN